MTRLVVKSTNGSVALLLSIFLLSLTAACKKEGPPPDAGLPYDVASPPDSPTPRPEYRPREWRPREARPDAAKAPHLNAWSHKGWEKPLCFDCHTKTAVYTHTQNYTAPTCVDCHGYNGGRHSDHAFKPNNCVSCHSAVDHVYKFNSPDDCIHCHFHPENPAGT